MHETLHALLGTVLHGETRLGAGRSLAIDAGLQGPRMRAVEMHELVHEDLVDNSCFGVFQQIIIAARDRARGPTRLRLDLVTKQAMQLCFDTQEGAATVREMAWIVANMDQAVADGYAAELPERYVRAWSRYYPFFGDPRETGYLGLPAPVYHVTLISVAIAAMSSPVLADFTDPAAILDPPDGVDLSPYSPDGRLELIWENLPLALDAVLESAEGTLVSYDPDASSAMMLTRMNEAIDRTINALQERFPEVRWITTYDRWQQMHAFRIAWAAHLGGSEWHRPDGPMPQGPVADISTTRALAASFSRMNAGSHAAADLPVYEVEWGAFVAAHRSPVPRLFHLIILATDPGNVNEELIPHATALVQSIPMSSQATASESPVAQGSMLVSECRMDRFVLDTAAPSGAPQLYYSDVTRIRALTCAYPNWQAWTISKCPSPNSLLWLIGELRTSSPLRYTRIAVDDLHVFLIWVDRAIGFCLCTFSQEALLDVELRNRSGILSDGIQIAINGRSVSMAAIARAAYWGFAGI